MDPNDPGQSLINSLDCCCGHTVSRDPEADPSTVSFNTKVSQDSSLWMKVSFPFYKESDHTCVTQKNYQADNAVSSQTVKPSWMGT